MKTFSPLITILLLITVSSCSKETLHSTQTNSVIADDNTPDEAKAAGLYRNAATGVTTLILQPGEGVGQDAWVKFWAGHPEYANENYDSVQLIKGLAMKIKGTLLRAHSYIKFTELSQVPTTAQVTSAKLYLYGPAKNYPFVSEHLPMGNTSYPGSPNNENSCYLRKVTSTWDESTLTWNTQPASTTQGQINIPKSDKQWLYNTNVDVTNMIKSMIQTPSENNGFLLILQNEQSLRAMGFCSSESIYENKRPKLILKYK